MAQQEQITNVLPSSSTPPPPSTVLNSTGLAGPGTNLAVAYSIGSTNSPLTTSVNIVPVNRNVSAPSSSTNANVTNAVNRDQVYTWIQELSSPDSREHALIELSRKREVLPDLAPMLWHSFGTIAALLQEIVMIYPVINPPSLNVSSSSSFWEAFFPLFVGLTSETVI